MLPFDRPVRLHITGASGSGTTTLARALAQRWSVPCHDTDDYYWQPSDPPFQHKREVRDRLQLMQSLFLPRRAWVLSGSLVGWGDALIPQMEAVVLLRLPADVRMDRLHAREVLRAGEEGIAPGSDGHAGYVAFMDWAAGYDDPTFTGRSLAQHLHWLDRLPIPFAVLDSDRSVAELVDEIAGPRA